MENTGSKFELIHEIATSESNILSVSLLCEIAGVSRSGYYNWVKSEDARRRREAQDKADFELILRAFNHRGYDKGIREIQMQMLHFDSPVLMNLKKISRIERKFNLKCHIRGPNPYRRIAKALKTSNVAENLLNREFEAHGPRRVLLTDITYIPLNGVFCYLSTILDAFTKQVLAYVLSSSLEVDFVLETVKMLSDEHGDELETDTLIHSDQGCHYTSYRFIDILKDFNLRQSMSRRGNCWDNAPQESFFGHMKDEIGSRISGCFSFDEAKEVIDDWIDYYNNERYVWDLAKLSPNEFYKYFTTGVYPLNISPATIRLNPKNAEDP